MAYMICSTSPLCPITFLAHYVPATLIFLFLFEYSKLIPVLDFLMPEWIFSSLKTQLKCSPLREALLCMSKELSVSLNFNHSLPCLIFFTAFSTTWNSFFYMVIIGPSAHPQ